MDPDLDADDPYDVLGLPEDATEDEVRKRARSLLDDYSADGAARTTINRAFEEIQQRPTPVEVGGVTVEPLLVSVASDSVGIGDETAIQVTDHTGAGVPGVELRRANDSRRIGKTGDDGTDTVRFTDSGTYTIIASKIRHPDPDHEYKDGEVEVSVKPRSDPTENLIGADSHDMPDDSSKTTDDEMRRFVRRLLDEYPDEYAARTAINEAFREVQQSTNSVGEN